MRHALSPLLLEAAEQDERFLVLSGDHGYELFDGLRTRYPERFVNVGVAEQSMVGIAAGLCRVGFRPCIYGLAAFVPMRVLEQVKIDLCHGSLPVIMLGDGAGLVYSVLGASHQCGEDIACLRSLPNIAVYSPCDAHEFRACWSEARQASHPICASEKLTPRRFIQAPCWAPGQSLCVRRLMLKRAEWLSPPERWCEWACNVPASMESAASPCRGSSRHRSNCLSCFQACSELLCWRSMSVLGGCGVFCWRCFSRPV